MEHIPNFGKYNKLVWAALIGGSVVLGLYLRRRSANAAATSGTDTSGDIPNTPDISGDALNPYSTMGSGTADTTGSGSIPGPAGPTGPAGPRGPRGKNGHTKNQHHGKNNGGKAGNAGGTTTHHHGTRHSSGRGIVASDKRNKVNAP